MKREKERNENIILHKMIANITKRTKQALIKRFDQYDPHHTGLLEANHIKHILTQLPITLTSIETNQFINDLDKNSDGYIEIIKLKEKLHLKDDLYEEKLKKLDAKSRRQIMILPTHLGQKQDSVKDYSKFLEDTKKALSLGSSELLRNPIIHGSKSNCYTHEDNKNSDQAEKIILEKYKNNCVRIRKGLSQLDGDQDGIVSYDEFENAIRNMNIDLSNDELCALLARYDTQNSGTINYREATEEMIYKHDRHSKQRERYVCQKVLEKLDDSSLNPKSIFKNKGGSLITTQELRKGLSDAHIQFSDIEFESLLNISNLKLNDKIDYWNWINTMSLKKRSYEIDDYKHVKEHRKNTNMKNQGTYFLSEETSDQHVNSLHPDNRKERVIVHKLLNQVSLKGYNILKTMFKEEKHINYQSLQKKLSSIGLPFSNEDYNRIWSLIDKKQKGIISLEDITETCNKISTNNSRRKNVNSYNNEINETLQEENIRKTTNKGRKCFPQTNSKEASFRPCRKRAVIYEQKTIKSLPLEEKTIRILHLKSPPPLPQKGHEID